MIEDDAADSAAMDAAVLGQDAVLNTIGGKTTYKETTLESSAASTIIKAMQRNGVRRLVVTSTLGEGESKANAPIYERVLVATFLCGANKDKAAMESAVTSSGLDWIILRPALFLTITLPQETFESMIQKRAIKLIRSPALTLPLL